MAQMIGVMNASNLVLFTGDSYAAATPIGFAQSVTIDISEDQRDTTNKFSQGWRTLAGGLRQFSISADQLFAENASNGEAELFAKLNTRSVLFFKVTIQDGSVGSLDEINGNTRYRGVCRVSSLSKTGGVEDNVTFSVTLEGTGQLIRETISE